MAERKFTRALNKPGMAAQLRETVSQVVRESAVLVSVVVLYSFYTFYLIMYLLALNLSFILFINMRNPFFGIPFQQKRVCLTFINLYQVCSKFVFAIFCYVGICCLLFCWKFVCETKNKQKMYSKDAFGKHLPNVLATFFFL